MIISSHSNSLVTSILKNCSHSELSVARNDALLITLCLPTQEFCLITSIHRHHFFIWHVMPRKKSCCFSFFMRLFSLIAVQHSEGLQINAREMLNSNFIMSGLEGK